MDLLKISRQIYEYNNFLESNKDLLGYRKKLGILFLNKIKELSLKLSLTKNQVLECLSIYNDGVNETYLSIDLINNVVYLIITDPSKSLNGSLTEEIGSDPYFFNHIYSLDLNSFYEENKINEFVNNFKKRIVFDQKKNGKAIDNFIFLPENQEIRDSFSIHIQEDLDSVYNDYAVFIEKGMLETYLSSNLLKKIKTKTLSYKSLKEHFNYKQRKFKRDSEIEITYSSFVSIKRSLGFKIYWDSSEITRKYNKKIDDNFLLYNGLYNVLDSNDKKEINNYIEYIFRKNFERTKLSVEENCFKILTQYRNISNFKSHKNAALHKLLFDNAKGSTYFYFADKKEDYNVVEPKLVYCETYKEYLKYEKNGRIVFDNFSLININKVPQHNKLKKTEQYVPLEKEMEKRTVNNHLPTIKSLILNSKIEDLNLSKEELNFLEYLELLYRDSEEKEIQGLITGKGLIRKDKIEELSQEIGINFDFNLFFKKNFNKVVEINP